MKTPVQMASKDPPQAEHYGHVTQDNMKRQIEQELAHAAQGQETSLNAFGRMPVTKEVDQPEVECGKAVDMQGRPHAIHGPVDEHRHRPLSRQLPRKHDMMTRTHNSGSGVHGTSAGASSSTSYSGGHGVRHSSNSNISAVGVNPNIAIAPHLQAPEQVIHHPVVEVPVEPPVVLFERGFLPNWENRMNVSSPGSLTIHPAVIE